MKQIGSEYRRKHIDWSLNNLITVEGVLERIHRGIAGEISMKDQKENCREMLYKRKEGRATEKQINKALNEPWTR
jgi:C4-type Zn-finger protein